MKRELGIARCGLACCLCSENVKCNGCYSDNCPDCAQCENRKCSIEKELLGCYDCEMDCKKGLLNKIKPYGFTLFIKRYGVEKLLDCLEENEKRGVLLPVSCPPKPWRRMFFRRKALNLISKQRKKSHLINPVDQLLITADSIRIVPVQPIHNPLTIFYCHLTSP